MEIIEIIDSKLGMLKVFPIDRIEEIEKKDTTLITGVLKVGEKTTLNDFFSNEVLYLGIHDNKMQFQVGEHRDLFTHEIWCNEFILINEECFIQIYKTGTARDYVWRKNTWR